MCTVTTFNLERGKEYFNEAGSLENGEEVERQ